MRFPGASYREVLLRIAVCFFVCLTRVNQAKHYPYFGILNMLWVLVGAVPVYLHTWGS